MAIIARDKTSLNNAIGLEKPLALTFGRRIIAKRSWAVRHPYGFRLASASALRYAESSRRGVPPGCQLGECGLAGRTAG
jgi:hypothetical protein